MCGICGIILTEPGPASGPGLRRLVERMSATLAHRGPDDSGLEVFGSDPPSPGRPLVALGHRRLSIIDVEGGHQPLANEDEGVWTVYNGEIYNFPALRRRLGQGPHRLRTRCDTEVLVHLYEENGPRLVRHLRGMFAFALWDRGRGWLLLARDRLGQKPLYYVHEPRRGLFAFASEVKALRELPGFDTGVDPRAIDRYLTYGYVPDPLCIFRSVKKLPPAHLLTYDPAEGRLRTERYWRPRFRPEPGPDAGRLRAELRHELGVATRMRMLSDAPLGAFLSGGVDSSITVALMAEAAGEPVRTFSIGFEEARFDETRYARMVARHCGTRHVERTVRPRALEVLPKLAWHYDEPFGDSSAIPTYYVSALARREVKVILTGDGGDECFAGYPRYVAAWLGGLFDRLPGPLKAVASPALWRGLPVSPRARSVRRRLRRLMLGLALPPRRRYVDWSSMFGEELKASLLEPGLRGQVRGEAAEVMLRFYEEVGAEEFLHATTYVDLMTYLPCDLLRKVDVASMAHGLEARSPFLDHRVVELAGRIPMRLKLRPGPRGLEGKRILKETFADLLPGPVLRRGKMGFGVPMGSWFRGELRDLLHEVVLSGRARRRGYFRQEALRRLVQEHLGGVRDHGYRLWSLLMLELWHRAFVDEAPLGI